MIRRLTLMVALESLAGSAAWAEEPRVEIERHRGLDVQRRRRRGQRRGRARRRDLQQHRPEGRVLVGRPARLQRDPNVEIGFLYNQQSTKLEVGGTSTLELGDESIYNYHGYFAYNFGEADAKVRPYVLGGLGATQYGASARRAGGAQRTSAAPPSSRPPGPPASSCIPGKNVGLRLEAPLDAHLHQVGRRRAGGATPTGAATWRATPSTRTSSSCRAASSSGSSHPARPEPLPRAAAPGPSRYMTTRGLPVTTMTYGTKRVP